MDGKSPARAEGGGRRGGPGGGVTRRPAGRNPPGSPRGAGAAGPRVGRRAGAAGPRQGALGAGRAARPREPGAGPAGGGARRRRTMGSSTEPRRPGGGDWCSPPKSVKGNCVPSPLLPLPSLEPQSPRGPPSARTARGWRVVADRIGTLETSPAPTALFF